MMLDMRKTTLQTRLNEFFRQTNGGDPISQQAFSKIRNQFSHLPFETLHREIVKEQYNGQYPLKQWNGHYLFSVDGTYFQLPRSGEIELEFGIRGGGDRPGAGVSVLYDVLNDWSIDPIITHTNMNERELCKKHISFLNEQLGHLVPKSIVLLDRGYPSADLLEFLEESGIRYVARCKNNHSNEIKKLGIGSHVITLPNSVKIRVVKSLLVSNEMETLLTNLFDLDESEFSALYQLRWGIETSYFVLKRELCVEKFSGKTVNSIYQDFWASMFLINAVAVFNAEADEKVQQSRKGKQNKHVYKPRTSDLIVTLRDRFIFAVLHDKGLIRDFVIAQLIKTIARSVTPIRKERHFPRSPAPSHRTFSNLKSTL